MENWSYQELQDFIHEDVEEFMSDGLNIRQASSRVQVEYARSLENNELEKLIIYMVLCEEGVKNGYLRDDIKGDTLELLGKVDLELCDQQLNEVEQSVLRVDINRILSLIK